MNITALRGPTVEAISDSRPRPLWSVMIPTFNCAKYLGPCLESVLAQDPGPDQMEIEVVDDCSTKDDPGAVVRELGQGRIKFHRNPANEGVTGNFNTCLRRSSGRLIHILHGDDYVLPGFYRRIGELAEKHPTVAFFHARALTLNEAGETQDNSPSVESLQRPGNDAAPFYYTNPFRTAGVVIRRTFYEQHGGYNCAFAHVADWDMWVRAIALGNGVCTDDILAAYRSFAGNDTYRLVQTGQNLRDCLKLANHWVSCAMPGFDLAKYREMVSVAAKHWAEVFRQAGNTEAYSAYVKLCEELQPPS